MSFFTKLLAILCGETKKQVISYTGPCCFHMLFTKNVPHILEKILFTLDYESFKKCLRVSKNLNSLLNSESFQKKARRAFHKEINLECERRSVYCSTATCFLLSVHHVMDGEEN